jgi:hypothetical protein
MSNKKLRKLTLITLNTGAGLLYVAAGLLFFGRHATAAQACAVIGLLPIAFGVGVVWADFIVYKRTKPSLLDRLLLRDKEV